MPYNIKDREAYLASRRIGLDRIKELGSKGGAKKGVPHKHFYNNPSAGESRTSLYVLRSSCYFLTACAHARGVSTVKFVQDLCKKLHRTKEFRHIPISDEREEKPTPEREPSV